MLPFGVNEGAFGPRLRFPDLGPQRRRPRQGG